jgi:hypothetical protein
MEDTCFLARGRANETCMVLPPSRLSFSINMAFSADALHKTETQVRHHAKNQDQAATFFWVGGGIEVITDQLKTSMLIGQLVGTRVYWTKRSSRKTQIHTCLSM